MTDDRALLDFLREEGAGELPHGDGRVLLEHLTGTATVLRRWGQPEWLQRAGLIHSVYGTEAFGTALLAAGRRAALAEMAGARAERLAFLFCVTPRAQLLSRAHAWMSGVPRRAMPGGSPDDGEPPPSPEELDALVMLHMANLAEQARAGDGSPGAWLSRVGELAELLSESESIEIPPVLAQLIGVSEDEEMIVRRAYREGLTPSVSDEVRAHRVALVAALCPVLGEPCVWEAYRARCRGDVAGALIWARAAHDRLGALGVAWDKRLSLEEWLELAEALERGGPPAADVTEPRALLGQVLEGRSSDDRPLGSPVEDPEAGRRRFHRYVESLSDPEAPARQGVYPDLPSTPWHDPQDFPLARYLESNGEAIREEILALDPSRFQPESEAIRRTGDWSVVFLYERGRRHDELARLCPVTMRGIEQHAAVRTSAGLSYISRMRPATHIAAHRGPTNLRLRCHLGITVPEGDCAIRVGEETRRWREGRCLVFDDHFEHEAWNRTGEERIVLIVDLWHPGLSAAEVSLLEGLHRHIEAQASRLSRYWQVNERARAGRAAADGAA